MELSQGWLGWPKAPPLHGVASFPSAMAKFAGPRLPLVMKALLCAHSNVYEAQRVTSTAFLAEVGAAWSGLLPGAQQGGAAPTDWH